MFEKCLRVFEKPALWASTLGGGPCCHGQRRDSGILNTYSSHCYRCGSYCLVVLWPCPRAIPDTVFERCLQGLQKF